VNDKRFITLLIIAMIVATAWVKDWIWVGTFATFTWFALLVDSVLEALNGKNVS
jgi:hypothetical protein